MKRLHGLVISWYYPPGNSSEGLVTYKLLKNSQFSYDVFTRKTHDATVWDRQTNESKLVADNVEVYQATTNDVDEWVNEAADFFKKNADKYDFIMSRVMPADSHLAAAKIKECFPNIFWVASFGDPLVNSPYIKVIEKKDNPFFLREYYFREQPPLPKLLHLAASPTRSARKRVWEKERIDEMEWTLDCSSINQATFENADLLIFNNQYQFERAFLGDYARFKNKGIIVPHGYDLSLYPKKKISSEISDDKKHFVYVGHLDALRNAKPLLDALGNLKNNDGSLGEKVSFDFYGHIDDGDKVAIIDNNIADLVTLHSDISYLDSLEKISQADWLILIDANLNTQLDEYIYFPAKLVDYLGARKNILAITQLRGASADIMRSVEAGQIVTHSADEIALYLAKIIYQNYSPTNYNKEQWRNYDARKIATEFDDILKKKLQ